MNDEPRAACVQSVVQRSQFLVQVDVADYFVEGVRVGARDLFGLREREYAYREGSSPASYGQLVALAHVARGARRRAVDRDGAGLAQLLRDCAPQHEPARPQVLIESHLRLTVNRKW